jgi:hypothetical protein
LKRFVAGVAIGLTLGVAVASSAATFQEIWTPLNNEAKWAYAMGFAEGIVYAYNFAVVERGDLNRLAKYVANCDNVEGVVKRFDPHTRGSLSSAQLRLGLAMSLAACGGMTP